MASVFGHCSPIDQFTESITYVRLSFYQWHPRTCTRTVELCALSMIVQNPTQPFVGLHRPNTLHGEDNDAVMLSACVWLHTYFSPTYVCMYVCMHIVYINQIERAWILKVLCVGDFMLVGMSEVIRVCLPQLVMYMLYTCMYRLWGRACCVSTGLPYIHVVTLGFLCMWYGSARGHYHALENVVTLQGQLGY